jgi:hypothetical protein
MIDRFEFHQVAIGFLYHFVSVLWRRAGAPEPLPHDRFIWNDLASNPSRDPTSMLKICCLAADFLLPAFDLFTLEAWNDKFLPHYLGKDRLGIFCFRQG